MKRQQGYRWLSAREKASREEEILRLHRLGCERRVLNERFGRMAVVSALRRRVSGKEEENNGESR